MSGEALTGYGACGAHRLLDGRDTDARATRTRWPADRVVPGHRHGRSDHGHHHERVPVHHHSACPV